MLEFSCSVLIWLLTMLIVDSQVHEVSSTEQQHIYGILDYSIPMHLTYVDNNGELIGSISYGDGPSPEKPLEGRLEDGSFTFYEIGEDVVTSVIKGSAHPDSTNWTWSRYNYSLQLPFQKIHGIEKFNNEVIYFDAQNKDNKSSAILIPDTRQLNMSRGKAADFRWMNYNCIGSDCYEIRPDENLENPLEFTLTDDQIRILPDNLLKANHSIQYQNITIDSNNYLLSYNYPVIDKNFDKWVNETIQSRIEGNKKWINNLSSSEDRDARLSQRHYGNFFISLLSNKIVSGYLVFHSTTQSKAHTIPFTYNRDKEKFIRLNDVFENDFDYAFFLKKYLESEKRKLIYQEDKVLKEVLKNENFGHYAFTPHGLVFFTEFNTLFGRRNMYVPYNEISSFVRDKTLSSYISKLQ